MNSRLAAPLLLALALSAAFPFSAGAATLAATTTVPTNTYVARSQVDITQPLPADLVTAGGTVDVNAPVNGEVLAAGGTVTVHDGAVGDVRVLGLKTTITGNVGGDVAAAGGTVRVNANARNVYAAGGSVDVEGSAGNVTIYGANVMLSGTYAGNVNVIATNRFSLGPGTHILGALKYRAPSELSLPVGAAIDGGAQYAGAPAYIPTYAQAHRYAVIGLILFFVVRLLSGVIVAGLIAGLFSSFAEQVSSRVLSSRPSGIAQLVLIGLALAILTPILCLLLLISFVGAGLAFLLLALYALMALLAYAFAGIVFGAFLRHTLLYRIHGVTELSWQDAVLGTVCLHIIGLIPYVGLAITVLLSLACAGTLAYSAYAASFALERESASMPI